jgi:DNA gyrase subunit A
VARDRLMTRFKLSELQAQAILDMQLRRLAALERQKIQDEHTQILNRIADLEDLLATPRKVLNLIKTDLEDISAKYGDDRRTRIAPDAHETFREEDLVAEEDVLISITQKGYIKRVAAKSFRAQARGGRGVTGHTTRDEDEILIVFPARTLDTLLFFSDRGKVYSEKAYQIPDADRAGKGIPMVNVLALEPGETITAAVPVPVFDKTTYCMMATFHGRIKRVPLSEFASVRPSGMISITLGKGDELGWVRLTNGQNDIILVTEKGQALRFSEQAIRSMGRQAAGVTGIRLTRGDRLTSMEVVEQNGDLMIVTAKGFGKRTPLEEYPSKGRATGGVKTIDQKALPIIGPIVSARVVQPADDLTIISAGGLILRTKVSSIKKAGRATRGVRLIELHVGDQVVSLARISAADLQKVGAS